MAVKKYESLYKSFLDVVNKQEEFLPTGSIVLDSVISNGKGLPQGVFISLAASYGAGKTTIALHISREYCQKGRRVLYIDSESGINRDQLDAFSLTQFAEQGLFIPVKIQTFTDAENILLDVLEDPELKLIVMDSITSLIPQRLLDKKLEDCNEPGLHARSEALFLQKFKHLFRNSEKTLLFINQFRTKIAMGYGQVTREQASGGLAFAHYMDIILTMRKINDLTKTDASVSDTPHKYGCVSKIRSEKNRYCAPFIDYDIALVYGKGIMNSYSYSRALWKLGIVREVEGKRGLIVNGPNGEEVVAKGKYEQYVQENLAYFKKIIENPDDLGKSDSSDESESESFFDCE